MQGIGERVKTMNNRKLKLAISTSSPLLHSYPECIKKKKIILREISDAAQEMKVNFYGVCSLERQEDIGLDSGFKLVNQGFGT